MGATPNALEPRGDRNCPFSMSAYSRQEEKVIKISPPRWPSGLQSGRSRVRISLAPGFFRGLSDTSDFKTGTPVATLPAACIIGSALGLVGPVSVYCDWVR